MRQPILYRHFDANDSLLYVGITSRSWHRQAEHLSRAGRAAEISRIEIERFATIEEALVAEKAAIKKEYPLHNRTERHRAETILVQDIIETVPEDVDYLDVPTSIQRRMDQYGLNPRALAAKAGVSLLSVSRILSGKRTTRIPTVDLLLHALDMRLAVTLK